MKKVLITGGAGFIGSHLADTLSRKGYQVTVFDNLSTSTLKNLSKSFKKMNDHGQSPWYPQAYALEASSFSCASSTPKPRGGLRASKIKFIKGNVLNKKLLEKSLKSIDCVFHLAALTNVPKSFKNPLEYRRVNINGTLNLLEASLKNNIKKVIFSSSCAVYGKTKKTPIKETDKKKPLSPYAISKLKAESACLFYAKKFGLDTVILRYFNVYGPRQNPGSPYAAVIPKFLKRGILGKELKIYGDGKQTRDFIYIDDVVEANIKALKLKKKKNTPLIFNIGSGKATSVNDLVKKIAKVLGKKLKVTHVAPRKGDLRYSQANVFQAKKFLNFSPKITLEKGLMLLIRSFN